MQGYYCHFEFISHMTYFSLGLRDRGGQVKGLDSLGSQLQLLKVWKEVVNWVVVEERVHAASLSEIN